MANIIKSPISNITSKSGIIKKSVKKLKPTCNLIRGRKVYDALLQLKFLKKKESEDISKTIMSAISNAQHNFQCEDVSLLKITKIFAQQKMKLKRIMTKGKGRAGRKVKEYSTIVVCLGYM